MENSVYSQKDVERTAKELTDMFRDLVSQPLLRDENIKARKAGKACAEKIAETHIGVTKAFYLEVAKFLS